MFLGVESIKKDYRSGESMLQILKGVSLEVEEGFSHWSKLSHQ